MNEVIIVIGSACAAVLFVIVLRWYLPIKKIIWPTKWNDKRIKPLDCEYCLSFWISFISAIFFGKNGWSAPYIGVTAAMLAIFITKKLK